jgi:uncharacterized protein YjlB
MAATSAAMTSVAGTLSAAQTLKSILRSPMPTPTIETAHFADDGRVPNNRLPVIVYRGAIAPDADDPAKSFEETFAKNRWSNSWRNGIYGYHHYHSNAHEVLGIAKGHARVRLGGESGRDFDLEAGDVVLLPAGTGHKRLAASRDLEVVGAYPEGRDWDLIKADDSDKRVHDEAVKRIANVGKPAYDPVMGKDGPLMRQWA